MGADDGQAPPRRDETNLNPPPLHIFPPRGGPLENFGLWPGPAFIPVGEFLANSGSPWQMETNQGWAPLRRGNHSNPSPHDILPRGGPLAIFFQCRGTNSPIGGTPGIILARQGG